jgi:uncharacterized protein YciI
MMFVVVTKYLKPTEEVAEHIAGHREWAQACYASGYFLASGRRMPPEGGIVIARAESRDDLERLLADDPFAKHGLIETTTYEIGETDFPHEVRRSTCFFALRSQAPRPSGDAIPGRQARRVPHGRRVVSENV